MKSASAGLVSALIYLSIALTVAGTFLGLTSAGDYTWVARLGGATWVFVLTNVVLMPLVIPAVQRRMK